MPLQKPVRLLQVGCYSSDRPRVLQFYCPFPYWNTDFSHLYGAADRKESQEVHKQHSITTPYNTIHFLFFIELIST